VARREIRGPCGSAEVRCRERDITPRLANAAVPRSVLDRAGKIGIGMKIG
jgi:hypothetical protein